MISLNFSYDLVPTKSIVFCSSVLATWLFDRHPVLVRPHPRLRPSVVLILEGDWTLTMTKSLSKLRRTRPAVSLFLPGLIFGATVCRSPLRTIMGVPVVRHPLFKPEAVPKWFCRRQSTIITRASRHPPSFKGNDALWNYRMLLTPSSDMQRTLRVGRPTKDADRSTARQMKGVNSRDPLADRAFDFILYLVEQHGGPRRRLHRRWQRGTGKRYLLGRTGGRWRHFTWNVPVES